MMSPYTVLAAAPVIDIDKTIFVQAGIFLVLFVILRKLVFLPYLEARRQRGEAIEGSKEKASHANADADEKLTRYERRLKEARLEAAAQRTQLRAEGEAKAQQVLGEARKRAEGKLGEARERIGKSVPAAELALRTRADELASAIATKVLGRPV